MDPWGHYQLRDLLILAETRNAYDWGHTVALVQLLGKALSGSITRKDLEEIKPGGG